MNDDEVNQPEGKLKDYWCKWS